MKMRVPLLKITANQIVNDVFIYHPSSEQFIFVDDVDVDDWEEDGIKYSEVVVYTEFWDKGKYNEIITRIPKDEPVFIVLNYPLDDKVIRKEVKETKHILEDYEQDEDDE